MSRLSARRSVTFGKAKSLCKDREGKLTPLGLSKIAAEPLVPGTALGEMRVRHTRHSPGTRQPHPRLRLPSSWKGKGKGTVGKVSPEGLVQALIPYSAKQPSSGADDLFR